MRREVGSTIPPLKRVPIDLVSVGYPLNVIVWWIGIIGTYTRYGPQVGVFAAAFSTVPLVILYVAWKRYNVRVKDAYRPDDLAIFVGVVVPVCTIPAGLIFTSVTFLSFSINSMQTVILLFCTGSTLFLASLKPWQMGQHSVLTPKTWVDEQTNEATPTADKQPDSETTPITHQSVIDSTTPEEALRVARATVMAEREHGMDGVSPLVSHRAPVEVTENPLAECDHVGSVERVSPGEADLAHYVANVMRGPRSRKQIGAYPVDVRHVALIEVRVAKANERQNIRTVEVTGAGGITVSSSQYLHYPVRLAVHYVHGRTGASNMTIGITEDNEQGTVTIGVIPEDESLDINDIEDRSKNVCKDEDYPDLLTVGLAAAGANAELTFGHFSGTRALGLTLPLGEDGGAAYPDAPSQKKACVQTTKANLAESQIGEYGEIPAGIITKLPD